MGVLMGGSGSGEPMKSRRAQGFTLVELIVVIAIITLLIALLSVFIVGVRQRAQNAKALAVVMALDKGCQTYKLEYNVYPPDDKGDSRNLHFYLAKDRMVSKGRSDDGSSILVSAPPILSIPIDWLKLAQGQMPDPKQPVPIIDPWDNLIRYKVPGNYNKRGVDIWSPGMNCQDDLVDPGGETDDLCNWIKEF